VLEPHVLVEPVARLVALTIVAEAQKSLARLSIARAELIHPRIFRWRNPGEFDKAFTKLFFNLRHARLVIETWRREYNVERPKKGLGGLTPLSTCKTHDREIEYSNRRTLDESATQEGVTPIRARAVTLNLSVGTESLLAELWALEQLGAQSQTFVVLGENFRIETLEAEDRRRLETFPHQVHANAPELPTKLATFVEALA
jgi:hypothetical protein